MWWKLVFAPLALIGWEAAASALAPLDDPIVLNIGINCQWQKRCMDHERHSMRHALKYVAKHQPPVWRVQQCNRNASRHGERVDWVGFDNCVRNAALIYVPPPPPRLAHQAKRHPHRARHRRH